MTRKLFEAKADLTSGIEKSLSGAALTLSEVEELEILGPATLITDHELSSIAAEIVVNHVKSERQRLAYQHQMTRDQLKESIRESVRSSVEKIRRKPGGFF